MAEDEPSSLKSKAKKGYSLGKVINLGQGVLVAILVFLAYTTYQRLNNFQSALEQLAEESLTTVIDSGEIFTQVNSLASISEQLLNANSDPFRRVSYIQIQDQLNLLYQLAEKQQDNAFTLLQLNTITRELSDLNQLVMKKLNINQRLHFQLTQMYRYHSLLLTDTQAMQIDDKWQLVIGEIVSRAGEVLIVDQLYLFEEQFKRKQALFEDINAAIQSNQISVSESQKNNITQLANIIVAPESGIYALRNEQLKLIGRARGRANMLRNLIKDYARLTEFESYQLNTEILNDARQATVAIKQQIQTISFVFAAAIASILVFSLFVSRYVVGRLLSMQQQIKQRINGRNQAIFMAGNDEITDLARTFESFAMEIEEQKQALADMSRIDPLTGIANRREFDERFTQEINTAHRQSWPVSLLLLDIDFFKQFNDNYGHAQGDICLKETAELLKRQPMRKTDLLARYGGEEFIILLPNTATEGAIKLAQEILNSFRGARIPHEHSAIADHLTVSIGIHTEFNVSKEIAETLFVRADKALYQAKENGRNRWEHYEHLTNTSKAAR